MTTADQTTRPDEPQARRRRVLVWPWLARRKFRPKRPVRIQTPPVTPPADQTADTKPRPSIWARVRGRLAARRRSADQPVAQTSAGTGAYALLVVFGLTLLGVIAGGFLVGYFNVVDALVRVVRVGDPPVIVAAAGIPRAYVDLSAPVPLLANIGAGVIELASTSTTIATVLLREAPWRVRAYVWLMFCGVLSTSVWAGVEHAHSRGYPVEAGWASGLWPLLVAATVHLFNLVRRHKFDPIARARQTARADRQAATPVTEQTSAPAPAPKPRQTRQAAPKAAPVARPTLGLVPIGNGDADRDALRAIRAAHQSGTPTLGQIKTAVTSTGQTCGQTKAIRLRDLLEQTDDADPDRAAAAAN